MVRALANAIWDADSLLSDHWTLSLHESVPCSTSCIEFPQADLTASQGREVASLRARITWSRACLARLVSCIWKTFDSCPTAHSVTDRSSYGILFFALTPRYPSLGHLSSGIAVIVSVVLNLSDFLVAALPWKESCRARGSVTLTAKCEDSDVVH